jgi:hypothetical protein
MKRPSRKSVGIAAGIGALAVAGFLAAPQILAPEVCITVYEDSNQGGDHMATCAVGAANVKRANLTLVTTGLNNGCNRGINQSSTWSDCISSATVAILPANTKIQWWRDINYTGGLLACFDANGTYQMNLSGTSDLISSFRIISGNC